MSFGGFGFKNSDFIRTVGEFSGGWLMRVALGKLLFSKPDALLLDEPTNHLDLDANLWFEKYLSSLYLEIGMGQSVHQGGSGCGRP